MAIALRIIRVYGRRVLADYDSLIPLRGIGPKIATLTLAVGFGRPIDRRGCPRPSCDNATGTCANSFARANHQGPRGAIASTILDRNQ